ncbi:MAG: hypothetical protein Q9194_003929, partial [Teloschistes cf. exilis]
MGFKDKCKKLFGRMRPEPPDGKEPKKPRNIPNLLKKKNRKVSPTLTTSTMSKTLVNTPPTNETAEDPSASPINAVNEPFAVEDHPCVQTSVSPLTRLSGEEEPKSVEQSPPIKQSSAETTNPAKNETSPSNNTSPDTPPINQRTPSSLPSNGAEHPTPDVYEPPGSFTLQVATAHPALHEEGPTSLNDAGEKGERRRGEAEFWGPMLSATHEWHLNDGLRESGMVASSGPLPNEPRPSLDVTTAASTIKLLSISRILREGPGSAEGPGNGGSLADITTNSQDPSTTLAPIRGLTPAADSYTEPTSLSQSPNPAVDGPMSLSRILNPDVSDDESVESDSPNARKFAYESSEMSHRNEVDELREDHAAKVAKLKDDLKKVEKRKTYVLTMTHEKLAMKDEEMATKNKDITTKDKQIAMKDKQIQRQSDQLIGLYRENSDKEKKIAEMEDRIKHLAAGNVDTTARTSSPTDQNTSQPENSSPAGVACNEDDQNNHEVCSKKLIQQFRAIREQIFAPFIRELARFAHFGPEWERSTLGVSDAHSLARLLSELRKHLENLPNHTASQNTHRQVCDERDMFRAELEKVRQELQGLNQVHDRTIRNLRDATREITERDLKLRERNSHWDGANDARKADKNAACKRCKGLEKDASDAFQLWKDAGKRHEEEKIRLQAKAEEKQADVNNLEGHINLREKQLARATAIMEKFIEDDKNQPGGVGRTFSKPSWKKITSPHKRRELNLQLRLRELMLNDKEDSIKVARDAQDTAQTRADKLFWQLESTQMALSENTQEFHSQLAQLASTNQDLQRQIESMLSSGISVADPETLHRHRTKVGQLHHRVLQLQDENTAHAREQSVQGERDFNTEACAAVSEWNMHVDELNYNNALAEIEELKRQKGDVEQGRDPHVFEMMRNEAALKKRISEAEEELEAEQQKVNCVTQLVDNMVQRVVAEGQDLLSTAQETLQQIHEVVSGRPWVEGGEEQRAEASNAAVHEEESPYPDEELDPNPPKTDTGKEKAPPLNDGLRDFNTGDYAIDAEYYYLQHPQQQHHHQQQTQPQHQQTQPLPAPQAFNMGEWVIDPTSDYIAPHHHQFQHQPGEPSQQLPRPIRQPRHRRAPADGLREAARHG